MGLVRARDDSCNNATTRHRVRGLHGPDTARLCAAARAQAPHPTGRPAIVAHVATGRADAAEHGHAPDQTEPPGQEAPTLFSEICNLIVLGRFTQPATVSTRKWSASGMS